MAEVAWLYLSTFVVGQSVSCGLYDTNGDGGVDGGWKYLSTNLWTTDYGDLESRVKGKIWW